MDIDTHAPAEFRPRLYSFLLFLVVSVLAQSFALVYHASKYASGKKQWTFDSAFKEHMREPVHRSIFEIGFVVVVFGAGELIIHLLQ